MRARCSRSTCYLKYLEMVMRQCALVVYTFSSRFVFDYDYEERVREIPYVLYASYFNCLQRVAASEGTRPAEYSTVRYSYSSRRPFLFYSVRVKGFTINVHNVRSRSWSPKDYSF